MCIAYIMVAGGFVLFGLSLIAHAIWILANNIGKVAHEIHIHAETMNEIRHDGIGIDKNMTTCEKFVSDIMRGKEVK